MTLQAGVTVGYSPALLRLLLGDSGIEHRDPPQMQHRAFVTQEGLQGLGLQASLDWTLIGELLLQLSRATDHLGSESSELHYQKEILAAICVKRCTH